MANAKLHHFLPQFLLAGFASRVARNEYYVWCLRAGKAPFESNTKNVAAESYFHGKTEDGDLERLIGRVENAPLVDALRTGTVPKASTAAIADFVAHLVIRTRNLRQSLVEGARDQLEGAREYFGTPEGVAHLRRYAFEKLLRDPNFTRALDGRSWLVRVAARWWLRSMVYREDPREFVDQMTAQLDAGLEQTIRRAHIRSLVEGPITGRAHILAPLRWTMEPATSIGFVLGDVGVVARQEPGRAWHSPILEIETPHAIALPISTGLVLVGTRAGETAEIDVEELNVASAELSREFIVASAAGERELRYADHIGRRSNLSAEAGVGFEPPRRRGG